MNAKSVPDSYLLPHIHDLKDTTIFSEIHVVKVYNQRPMVAVDIPKTATITPFVVYEISHMRSDLIKAAQTFQRLIDDVS